MSYAERARQARQNNSFRPIEGPYRGRLKSWEFKLSTEGNPQFILDWKVLSAPTPEELEKYQKNAKRTLRIRYVFSEKTAFQFDAFLMLLEDLGADLSTIRSVEEDPDYVDFRNLMDCLEKTPPDADLTVAYPKKVNPAYPNSYNLRVGKIEKVFAAGYVPSAQPVQAPVAQAPAAPVAAPAPAPQAPVQFTREQLIAAGWTDDTLRADPTYAHLAAPVPVAAPPAPPAAPAPAPAPAGGRKW